MQEDAIPELYTVGHSNHPFDRFVEILDTFEIDLLADVRTVPKSRKWPHFHTEQLARSLPSHGIRYAHMPGLVGWRRPAPDSPNGAWHNASFRGYADYALTAAFAEALDSLVEVAGRQPTAIMCSEVLWWRCHRRLIADRLVNAGWTVQHIGSDARAEVHRLAAFADPQDDGRVLYPAPPLEQEEAPS